MWDVVWTDPDRKLVGEHRASKIRKRETNDTSSAGSVERRDTPSVRSTRSSESPFAFLKAKRRRNRRKAKETSSSSTGSAPQSVRSAASPLRLESAASGNLDTEANVPEVFEDALRLSLSATDIDTRISNDTSQDLSWQESIFSRATNSDEITERSKDRFSTPSEVGQQLGQKLNTYSIIPKMEEEGSSLTKQGDQSQAKQTNMIVPDLKLTGRTVLTPPDTPLHPPPLNIQKLPRSPGQLATLMRASQLPESPVSSPGRSVDTSHDNDDTMPRLHQAIDQTLIVDLTASDLRRLERDIEMMRVATPEIALSRLKEAWVNDGDKEMMEELEVDRTKWFLSVLYGTQRDENDLADGCSRGARKELLLGGSPNTVSYLAVLSAGSTLQHVPMTSDSLHGFIPQRTDVESVLRHCGPLSLARIHTAHLPVAFPLTEIPPLLETIHDSLEDGGCLDCIIINPLPNALSLGYRLRAWLEEHLLTGLVEAKLCTSPSLMMPDWLKAARLRGPGSTKATTKFYAVEESVQAASNDPTATTPEDFEQKKIRAELLSLVGRRLWTETWGPYVKVESWWWEDEKIVEECVQLGTFWEYHRIQGVKQM